MNNELFTKLENEISETRTKLSKLEEAHKLLNEVLNKITDIEPPKPPKPPTVPAGAAQIVVERQYNYSLLDTIASIVKNFGQQEFGVKDVLDVLERNVAVVPNNPASRIAMVLRDLIAKNAVVRTFKGGGCVPYRYRAANTSSKCEPINDGSYVSSMSWASNQPASY